MVITNHAIPIIDCNTRVGDRKENVGDIEDSNADLESVSPLLTRIDMVTNNIPSNAEATYNILAIESAWMDQRRRSFRDNIVCAPKLRSFQPAKDILPEKSILKAQYQRRYWFRILYKIEHYTKDHGRYDNWYGKLRIIQRWTVLRNVVIVSLTNHAC